MIVVGERYAFGIDFHNDRCSWDRFGLAISKEIVEPVSDGVRARQHSDLVGAFEAKHSRQFGNLFVHTIV